MEEEKASKKPEGQVRILLVLLLLLCCQTDLGTQKIVVKMIGVFEEPGYLEGDQACNDSVSEDNGWFEPLNQTYTLKKVTLQVTDPADGLARDVVIFDADPVEYRVTYRIQKIFSKEISESALSIDLVGKTINSVRVTFSDQIKGVSKYEANHTVTLGGGPSEEGAEPCATGVAVSKCDSGDEAGDCSAVYSEPVSVGKGQSYSFVVKVRWKRTVNRVSQGGALNDISMLTPTLRMSVSEG